MKFTYCRRFHVFGLVYNICMKSNVAIVVSMSVVTIGILLVFFALTYDPNAKYYVEPDNIVDTSEEVVKDEITGDDVKEIDTVESPTGAVWVPSKDFVPNTTKYPEPVTAPSTSNTKISPIADIELVEPDLATHDEDGNIIVRYTTYGFDPKRVNIYTGDGVHFINTNILPMWVKAVDDPRKDYAEYASMNQGRSASQGGSYIFTFTEKGSWNYYNVNNEEHGGSVRVSKPR